MPDLEVSVIPKLLDTAHGGQIYTERRSTEHTSHEQTILCIHGLGGTVDVFSPIYSSLLSALPSAVLLSYDWPGHGNSAHPGVHNASNGNQLNGSGAVLALSDLVAALETVIASEIPDGRITLVAHSAGTLLASLFLTQAAPALSARISHAIFIGGPMETPFPAEVVARQQSLADVVAASGPHAIVDMLLPALTGPTTMRTRPVAAALVRALVMAQTKEGYVAAIRAFSNGFADTVIRWADLPGHVRMLVIGGSEDAMVGPSLLSNGAAKMGAEHVTLDDAGHIPMVESPEETVRVIAAFLSSA